MYAKHIFPREFEYFFVSADIRNFNIQISKRGSPFISLRNCKFDKKCFRVSYVIVSISELLVYLASSFVISSIYANFFCQNLIMERTFLFPCQMLNIIHHYIHHHIIISRYSEYVSLVYKRL